MWGMRARTCSLRLPRPARHLVTIPFLCMCVCATLTCSSVVCRPGRPMCSRGWLIRVRVYIFLLQLPSPYKFNVPLLQPVDAERFINTQYMSGHWTRHAAQAATRLATPTRAEGNSAPHGVLPSRPRRASALRTRVWHAQRHHWPTIYACRGTPRDCARARAARASGTHSPAHTSSITRCPASSAR